MTVWSAPSATSNCPSAPTSGPAQRPADDPKPPYEAIQLLGQSCVRMWEGGQAGCRPRLRPLYHSPDVGAQGLCWPTFPWPRASQQHPVAFQLKGFLCPHAPAKTRPSVLSQQQPI